MQNKCVSSVHAAAAMIAGCLRSAKAGHNSVCAWAIDWVSWRTSSLLCGGGHVTVGGFMTRTEQATDMKATMMLMVKMKHSE